MNRSDISKHCETIGNTVVSRVNDTQITAGRTAIVCVPYWYVKWHRGEHPDVALFTNPNDWLEYMDSLKPLSMWFEGSHEDSYGADNPTFAQLQYLTIAVEEGRQFVYMGMRIWAEKQANGRYYYSFTIGEKHKRSRSKTNWRRVIKPYLWDWQLA